MVGNPPAQSAKSVLIVEDNALNLKLLHDVLEYHGYLLLTTGSGEAAIEMARQTSSRSYPDGYSAA